MTQILHHEFICFSAYSLNQKDKYQSRMQTNLKKVLVIGGGPAGLSTLKALEQLKPQVQVDCFEKQNDWSGQWNNTWRVGVDQYGERVHSSMYSQLWTNIPKQCFEFPDYTFKDHFIAPIPSFLPRDINKNYFMTRFQRLGLKKHVHLNHSVKHVKYHQNSGKFDATVKDLVNNSQFTRQYDNVVVATGHYSVPNFPTLKGIENFSGTVFHSHDVKQFSQFRGKNVMIVGGGLSAEDFVLQCHKYGSKSIHWASRRLSYDYITANLPTNVKVHPLPIKFHENNGVTFSDSVIEHKVDMIVFCTGYLKHYPFLEEPLRLMSPSAIFPKSLYRGVAFQPNPKLMYIGMGNYNFSQVIIDIQAHLARDLIDGRHQVPKDLGMKAFQTDQIRTQNTQPGKKVIENAAQVVKYARELIDLTKYPNFNVEGFVDLYGRNIKHRQKNIVTYRDQDGFKSTITGQVSVKGNKTWLSMKDSEVRHGVRNQRLDKFHRFEY